MAGQKKGNELQRLAQTHLIGQNAPEIGIAARRKPAEARLLIGPEHPCKRWRHSIIGLAHGLEVVNIFLEASVALKVRFLVQIERAVCRQKRLPARKLARRKA